MNRLFKKARETFLNGQIDWLADDIKAVLVDHDTDAPLPDADEFLSDIAVGARVAISPNLTGKTSTDGVADAGDVTLPLVSGASAESIVLFKDTGNPATSPLIAFIDTGIGLPITPNGGNIILRWNNGANRIFVLGPSLE